MSRTSASPAVRRPSARGHARDVGVDVGHASPACSETISTGRPVHVQVAASTSLRLTAHTSQWSCVTMTSGASAFSASPSTR